MFSVVEMPACPSLLLRCRLQHVPPHLRLPHRITATVSMSRALTGPSRASSAGRTASASPTTTPFSPPDRDTARQLPASAGLHEPEREV